MRTEAPAVMVIGGGPAGSTAATALAQKGHQVLLLERERFPREHIGESLLPASMPFLEWLGVLPAIEDAGFLRKWGTTMLWGKTQEPWSWYFRETNQRYEHTYQVWRAHFDKVLLDNARAHGVDVREGHRVTEVLFDEPSGPYPDPEPVEGRTGHRRAVGVRFRDPEGQVQEARSSWVVDASGQGAVIGHSLGLRRWDDFFQNMAVYAYFEGAERLPAPNETNLFIESYRDGWLWCIPLHTGWMSVGAVVDSKYGQDGARRGMEAFLTEQIRGAPRVARMLRDARLVHGPVAVKDWSYISQEVAGDGWILAGDAACFIDPLFSSGIHLAMMSGAMAAAYVTTALKDSSMRGPGALFYRDQYYQEYGQFREMAKLFYSTNRTVDSYFWEARRILEEASPGSAQGVGSDLTPRDAFIRAVAGRPPRGYERVVVESGEAPAGFMAEVRRLEATQAARREALASMLGSEAGRSALLDWRPRLSEGVRLQKQPEVRDGEFAWSIALSRGSQRMGEPLDGLGARLAAMADGSTAVRQMVIKLTRGRPAEAEAAVLDALQRLFVDGAVTGP